MTIAFKKNKNNVEILTFKTGEDFYKSLINNKFVVLLSSNINILKFNLKDINTFIVEEEDLDFIKSVIKRMLIAGENEDSGKNVNSMCRIINQIHSREINGAKIKSFFPAEFTNENLLKEINTSRDNCLKENLGYKETKRIAYEFLRLKSALNLNNY